MPHLFISYRRSDSQPESLQLYKSLVQAFGQDNVFIDQHSMPLGTRFPSYLSHVINNVDAVLVVFGNEWASCRDKEGRQRLSKPSDYVRMEIRQALFRSQQQQIPVIPVAVQGATLNELDILPQEIAELANMNGESIRPGFEQEDTATLIKRLKLLDNNFSNGSTGHIKPPPVAEYPVNLFEALNIHGGPAPTILSKDAQIKIRKRKKDGWQREIISPTNPGQSSYWMPLNAPTYAPIEYVISILIEWYQIRADQCVYWYERDHPSKWMQQVSNFMGKKREGEWRTVFPGNVYYTRLLDAVKAFNDYFYLGTLGLCDVMPQPGEPIHPNYNVFGAMQDKENRVFGEYICTLTSELGGVDQRTQNLFYCPSIPNTDLRFVDLRHEPHLHVPPHAHVGKDEEGFHIVYI